MPGNQRARRQVVALARFQWLQRAHAKLLVLSNLLSIQNTLQPHQKSRAGDHRKRLLRQPVPAAIHSMRISLRRLLGLRDGVPADNRSLLRKRPSAEKGSRSEGTKNSEKSCFQTQFHARPPNFSGKCRKHACRQSPAGLSPCIFMKIMLLSRAWGQCVRRLCHPRTTTCRPRLAVSLRGEGGAGAPEFPVTAARAKTHTYSGRAKENCR